MPHPIPLSPSQKYPAFESIWKLGYTILHQTEISRMFPAPVFPGEDTTSKIIPAGRNPFFETGKPFLEWLENAYSHISNGSMPYGQDLAAIDPSTRPTLIETLYEEVVPTSVEAQLMMRIYRNLPGILDSTVSGHGIPMADDLLGKLYTSTLTASGSMIQLRRVIDLVGHKNPSAKYLEIGCGTRGATREILDDVLGARAGGRRYGSYCFTDVSSYFLSGARDEFRDCPGISYATLNIEEPPSEQGIVENSYDVVVAVNVLHATRSLEETLRKRAQAPEAKWEVILVETTIETVWLTIVLGRFSDYWKGRRDGRPTSPFIPVELWNQMLPKTMNVLVSSVSESFTNGAGAGAGNGSIERLYASLSTPLESASLFHSKADA
ncbi:hypothetical protein BDW59DRAFT_162267 [Aspergillus cavernicola]|uniref:Methyltransferase type 12 domain-containing protein n=1 Tax=Aspergillus cavernicola TaxID=176166 RepID=A0ABR4IA30_9EURO